MGTVNQIKKNLIAKEKIENDADNPQKLRDVKPSVLASLFEVMGGGCTECGKRVSYMNLEFFGFDVSRVKCFSCQERMREEDDYPYPEEAKYSKEENREVLQIYNLK